MRGETGGSNGFWGMGQSGWLGEVLKDGKRKSHGVGAAAGTIGGLRMYVETRTDLQYTLGYTQALKQLRSGRCKSGCRVGPQCLC